MKKKPIYRIFDAISNSPFRDDCYGTSLFIQDTKKLIGMDTLKIIKKNDLTTDTIGVFHNKPNNEKYNSIFLAHKLTNHTCSQWHIKSQLSDTGSMGNLYSFNDNEYTFAYEHESDLGNTISINHYDSYTNLLQNNYFFQYWLNKNLYLPNYCISMIQNIGTPSTEEVSLNSDQINLKFHYFSCKGIKDMPGYGHLKINSYQSKAFSSYSNYDLNFINSEQEYDRDVYNKIKIAGGYGKIGQRDFFQYKDQVFYVYEAQTCSSNYESDECWASWRLFLYSPNEKQALKIKVNGCGENASIANPHTTVIGNYLILSAFVPSQTFSTMCTPGEFIRKITINQEHDENIYDCFNLGHVYDEYPLEGSYNLEKVTSEIQETLL